MDAQQLKELKALQEENSRLKWIFADKNSKSKEGVK